jgi:autotransporter adhesin
MTRNKNLLCVAVCLALSAHANAQSATVVVTEDMLEGLVTPSPEANSQNSRIAKAMNSDQRLSVDERRVTNIKKTILTTGGDNPVVSQNAVGQVVAAVSAKAAATGNATTQGAGTIGGGFCNNPPTGGTGGIGCEYEPTDPPGGGGPPAPGGWSLGVNGGSAAPINPGSTLQLLEGPNTTVSWVDSGLGVPSIQIGVVENPTFTGMATLAGGLTVTSGQTIALGNNVVSGLGAGELSATSTEAVNGSQLNATNVNVTNVTNNLANLSTNVTTIGTNLINLDNTVALGLNVALGPETDGDRDTVNLGLGGTLGLAADSNLEVSRSGSTFTYRVVDAPTFAGSVTMNGGFTVGANQNVNMGGNVVNGVGAGAVSATSLQAVNGSQLHALTQTVNNLSTTVGSQDALDYDPATGTYNANRGGTPTVISGVANGAVNATSTDAVNGSQLHATNVAVTNLTGRVDTIENNVNNLTTQIGTIGQVASRGFDVQVNGGAASNVAPGATVGFNNGNNIVVTQNGSQFTFATVDNPTYNGTVTMNGGFTVGANQTVNMGGNVVSGVGNGLIASGSTEAINGGQIYDMFQDLNGLNDNRITSIENDVFNLRSDMQGFDRAIKSGIASALSIKSAPYVPGKVSYTVSTGFYEGYGALGTSWRYTGETGRWSLEGAFTRNDKGNGASLSFSGVID